MRRLPSCLAALALAFAMPDDIRAEPPACLSEETVLGRAACLDARADRLLHALAAHLAQVAATAGTASLADGLTRGQRAWRAAMEAECADLSAPVPERARLARARCRLAAAERRVWTIRNAFASFGLPGGGLFGGLDPEIEILLPPPRRGGPQRR